MATPLERVKDALVSGSFDRNEEKMINVEYGGQFGYSPKLGRIDADGKNYSEWISNHKYVSKNVIAVVIQAPRFFDFMPDPDKWVKSFKSLIELHSKSIEGLTSGLTAEFSENAVGGAGEMQEEISDVKRARSTITHTWEEKAGKPINRFLTDWIRYGMMDPDTKTALVGTLEGYETDLYTPDYYTATVLYFEPDITGRNVVEAWLCTNMAPKSNGEVTGKRDLTTAGETKELPIEFTSITMYNQSVNTLARNILNEMNSINKVDPHTLPTFVSNEVADAKDKVLSEDQTPIGYSDNYEEK